MNEAKKRFSLKDIIYLIVIVLLIGGLVTTSILLVNKIKYERIQYNAQDYYDKKLVQFEMENANLAKNQIVFIGDSITDLYHLDDYYQDLPLKTYNRGIGGDVTGCLVNRLKTSLYDLQPSKVVLMIGINDINGGVSKETILENYQNILKGINTNLPTTKLFVMSILPINDLLSGAVDVDKSNEMVIDINSKIKDRVVSYPYEYLDLFSLVKDENNKLKKEYSDDGIHLNDEGFKVWTNLVKPSLL